MELLHKNLIFLNLDCKTKEELIHTMCSKLQENGAVKESFADAVLSREQNYPTGLPTEPYCVAIPHTGAEHVNRITVAVATVKEPVLFDSIELTGEKLPVRLVFLQALRDADQHLEFTKALMKVFRDGEKLEKIIGSSNPEEVYDLLKDLNS